MQRSIVNIHGPHNCQALYGSVIRHFKNYDYQFGLTDKLPTALQFGVLPSISSVECKLITFYSRELQY